MSQPEGGPFANSGPDYTTYAINRVTRTMGYDPGSGGEFGQVTRSAGAEVDPIEVDTVTPVQPGEVASYLQALAAFNARRDDLDGETRAGRDQAYAALITLMEQREGQIRPDMSMSELAAFLEQEAFEANLAGKLSAEGGDRLYETFDLLQEYANDPGEVRWMVENERRHGAEIPGQPEQVAGATSDPSGEPQERTGTDPREQLAGQALSFAYDNAIINTNARRYLPVRVKDGREGHTIDGQNTFGPGGRELPSHMRHQPGPYNAVFSGDPDAREYAQDIVEAVSFTPVIEPVYETVTTRQGGGIFRRPQETRHQEKIGERPHTIVNPATGREEQAVYFDYVYDPHLASPEAQRRMHLPPYRECDGSRTDNMLVVRATLPQSVAQELEAAIRQDPTYARQLAEQIVLRAGGVSQEAWEQGEPRPNSDSRFNRMKPPYEGLPADHQIHILEPFTTEYGSRAYLASPL